MDSLQGIPVEYRLNTFNKPRTGRTLCHPKIGSVNATLLFRKRQLALNSPLGHLNGESAYSPQKPDTKLTVTSKVQFLQLQHAFHQNATNTIPHMSTTHAAISTSHNSISSQYSQHFTSLAAPKANPIFHAANKNLIPKTSYERSPSIFFIILLLFLTNLARGLTTLSEETIQRKHTYVTPSSSLNTNKLPSR